jgi:hypothetical protein
MINTFTLEPNTITNMVKHDGNKIKFYVVEGACIFETTFNNETTIVEKTKHENYIIQEKVEYRLQNTCNTPCVLVIITGSEEKLSTK